MSTDKFGHGLGAGVLAVAVFNTLSAASRPLADGRRHVLLIAGWLILLLAHAVIYWHGDELRRRIGLSRYVALQTGIVFGFGLSGALLPVVGALYLALTAEVVTLSRGRWSSASITVAAILLFAANAILAFDLYQGATIALLLALTGIVAHALSGLRTAPAGVGPLPAPSPPPTPAPANGRGVALTQREIEVLQALVSGARTTQIAESLGIAERTVKAHLASIYLKLGVESRAAAVAVAIQRGLVF